MANHANPHEQAFHRWSIPDFAPDMSPPRPMSDHSFALAPTMRGDSPEAFASMPVKAPPPSFRVYTPSSHRPALRPGRIAPKGNQDEGINARVLLKWTGIGIVAGFAVLAALVLILNFADDGAHTSTHPPVVANITAAPPKPVQATPVAATPAVAELELAPTPPPKKKAPRKKK